jgi:hypothetical protein
LLSSRYDPNRVPLIKSKFQRRPLAFNTNVVLQVSSAGQRNGARDSLAMMG